MSQVELIVLIILALMGLPDLMKRWKRSALIYPAYVIIGLLLGPILDPDALALVRNVGEFGFIMLLFGIGLEIDFPALPDMRAALRIVRPWVLSQVLVIPILALLAVPGWPHHPWSVWAGALVATVALISCSIGITFPAWLSYRGPSATEKAGILNAMILLEVPAIAILTASSILFHHGFGWRLAMNLAGVALVIILIRFMADHMAQGLRLVLDRVTRWKVHFIVLFVLAIGAIGNRLGLAPSKTAFFLGLGISRSTHEGLALEHHLRPVSRGLLIPIFFVSLGASVPTAMILSFTGVIGCLSGVFLLALRESVYRRCIAVTPASANAHLLLGPNLTIAAIAMNALVTPEGVPPVAVWMIFASLTMTILSLVRLPPDAEDVGL